MQCKFAVAKLNLLQSLQEIFLYARISLCTCEREYVYMCVCAWKRERQREREFDEEQDIYVFTYLCKASPCTLPRLLIICKGGNRDSTVHTPDPTFMGRLESASQWRSRWHWALQMGHPTKDKTFLMTYRAGVQSLTLTKRKHQTNPRRGTCCTITWPAFYKCHKRQAKLRAIKGH